MRKYVVICAAICASIAFTSCGSSKESAYRKAYEKAKAQEQAQQQTAAEQPSEQQTQQQGPVVLPMTDGPEIFVKGDNNEVVPVRSENLTVVNGAGLKAYSVVVGSFGVRANAEGLQNTLNSVGYSAQVVYNAERNMYRVVATTFDSKASAIESRNSLSSKYPDAWLLKQ